MGQSAPTVTDAFETFQARYAAFRAELDRSEQAWFDELVCGARRHSNAINRRPHLDFERPVMLAMLLEAMRQMDDQGRDMMLLRSELDEALRDLRNSGMVPGRTPLRDWHELSRLGQTVLVK